MKKQGIELIMAVLLLVSMFLLSREAAEYVMSNRSESRQSEKKVVIDIGHGGDDPGKVGVNGTLEKDVNLAIGIRVKELLEDNDVAVIMTRQEDNGLYEEGASNKKVQDMKKRIELIEKASPELIISIHQNSYHQESISGAQVFYYTTSQESKKIAELMQKHFIARVDKDNTRTAKSNNSYYLLKKTKFPIIIVECGFLSNWKEAEALATKEYQEKIAWAIHMGVMEYLNQ